MYDKKSLDIIILEGVCEYINTEQKARYWHIEVRSIGRNRSIYDQEYYILHKSNDHWVIRGSSTSKYRQRNYSYFSVDESQKEAQNTIRNEIIKTINSMCEYYKSSIKHVIDRTSEKILKDYMKSIIYHED